MTITHFFELFPDETACREYVKTVREANGVVCKKCCCTKQYWLAAKEQWQCSQCAFRTTLRSGTLFESSKLRLRLWFQAIFLMSNSKKGMSACELQRQLGLKRNEPVWYMMHKIRKAMARINELEQVSGEINTDDAFFVTIASPGDGVEIRPEKRGGEPVREKALMMVESMPTRSEYGSHRSGKLRMFRARPVAGQFIWERDNPIAGKRQLSTYRYRRLFAQETGLEEDYPLFNRSSTILPWIHTALGNARRLIDGIHHHISAHYVQQYLDEFGFKFNHRKNNARCLLVFRQAMSFHW